MHRPRSPFVAVGAEIDDKAVPVADRSVGTEEDVMEMCLPLPMADEALSLFSF